MTTPETPKPAAVPVVNYREKARAAYTANAPKVDVQPVDAQKRESVEAPPPVEVKTEAKPEQKPEEKKAAPPSDTIAKSFEKLAVEREALRKERAEFEAKTKDLEALLAAKTARDPRALLALAGLTHEDYVRAYTGKEVPPDEEPRAEKDAKPQPNAEFAELQKQFEDLRAELQREKFEKSQRQVVDAFVPHLKSLEAEFPLSARLGEESVREALEVMKQHFARTGKHISEDPLESFRAAIAVVEEGHQATVRKYGLLTSEKAPAKVQGQSEAPESPRRESVALTNGDGTAPLAPKSPPTKPEDYRARAREAYRKHTSTP